MVNRYNGYVYVVDIPTLAFQTTITGLTNPGTVLFTSNGDTAFVLTFEGHTAALYVYNASTYTLITSYAYGYTLGVLSLDDAVLYCCFWDDAGADVYSMNTSTGALTTIYTSLPVAMYGLMLSADGSTLYLAGLSDLYSLDIATGALTTIGAATVGYSTTNTLLSAIVSPPSVTPDGYTSVSGVANGTSPTVLDGLAYFILPSNATNYEFNATVSAACEAYVSVFCFGSGGNNSFSNPSLTGAAGAGVAWGSGGLSDANLVLPIQSPGVMAVDVLVGAM